MFFKNKKLRNKATVFDDMLSQISELKAEFKATKTNMDNRIYSINRRVEKQQSEIEVEKQRIETLEKMISESTAAMTSVFAKMEENRENTLTQVTASFKELKRFIENQTHEIARYE